MERDRNTTLSVGADTNAQKRIYTLLKVTGNELRRRRRGPVIDMQEEIYHVCKYCSLRIHTPLDNITIPEIGFRLTKHLRIGSLSSI
jgi:hypothetical protein